MLSETRFLDLMAAAPAPVTVVTAAGPSGPAGSTVSAFMSLSLHPMLVVVSLDQRSKVLPVIEAAGGFGVNVLAAAQTATALKFARSGADKFDGVDWDADHGLPRLAGTVGWLACDLADVHPGGDHKLLVGAVKDVSFAQLPPLVYSYRLFGVHSEAKRRFRTPAEAHVAALSRSGPPPLTPIPARPRALREHHDA